MERWFVGFLASLKEKVLVLIALDVTSVPNSSWIRFPQGRFRCVPRHLLWPRKKPEKRIYRILKTNMIPLEEAVRATVHERDSRGRVGCMDGAVR